MLLIINASPLIFLSKIDLVQHLPSLFDQIVIPRGVYEEVTAHDDKASQWIKKYGKQYVSAIGKIPGEIYTWDLGKGETEVIASAIGFEDCIVALDDKAARNCALSYQLKIIGTIGLILRAKKMGLIEDGELYLNKLIESGFRISENLLHHAVSQMKRF